MTIKKTVLSASMLLATIGTACLRAQSLDIRVELRNQMRYLEVKRREFDNSFLGMQVQMYTATKTAEDYLRAHRLENPFAVLTDPDDDHFGPRLYKLIVSAGKLYRDAETQRIDGLQKRIERLDDGTLPGYSTPKPEELAHGAAVRNAVRVAEKQLTSYSLACDRDEWMHQQIQSTVARADQIEDLIRTMYQAQDEEQKRRAQAALDRARQEAEAQRQRLAQSLRDHPTPDEFHHDHLDAPDRPAQGPGPSQPQRDAFPLDRSQRDMIGGVMQALDREVHQGPSRPD